MPITIFSKQREQHAYALEGDPASPRFVTREIEPQALKKIHLTAKSLDATLNDAVLAAYSRVLAERTGEARVILPCPVDLRRYQPTGEKPSICNLTSNFLVDVTVCPGDPFEKTLRQVSKQLAEQKGSNACLKSVLMLETAFRLMPYRLLEQNFHRFFQIPVLSYSNLGVIDCGRLCFAGTETISAYITGAVKRVPYFQVAVSTFDDRLTMSSNLYGTERDLKAVCGVLAKLADELERFSNASKSPV